MLSEKAKHISECQKTDKPWGYEILWAQTKNYVSKIMCIQPHQRMSLQYHNEKEETIYFIIANFSRKNGKLSQENGLLVTLQCV